MSLTWVLQLQGLENQARKVQTALTVAHPKVPGHHAGLHLGNPPNSCDLLSIPISPTEDEPLLPEIPKCDANVLDTSVVVPGSWLSNTFRQILTHRSFVSEFHNFLLGLQLHTDYLQNGQFSMWKGTPTWLLPKARLCLEAGEVDLKAAIATR